MSVPVLHAKPIFAVLQVYGLVLFLFLLWLYCWAVYLILMKSPLQMRVYRTFLLVTITADFMFALGYDLVLLPLALYPAPGAIVLGLAKGASDAVNVSFFLLCVLATVVTILAQCYSLLYRFVVFHQSVRIRDCFHRPAAHVAIIAYGAFACIVILSLLGGLQQDSQEFRAAAIASSSLEVRDSDAVIGFYVRNPRFLCWAVFVAVNLGIALMGSYVFLGAIFHTLRRRIGSSSSKMVRVQWNFAKASLIQLILPFFFLYLPCLLCVCVLLTGVRQFATTVSFLTSFLLATYPVANTLVVTFYIQSYRRYTIRLLLQFTSFCRGRHVGEVRKTISAVDVVVEGAGAAEITPASLWPSRLQSAVGNKVRTM